MKFEAELLASGKTATGIEVPEAIIEALGQGKRPAIRVTLRDHTYRTTIGVMGGRYLIPVSAEHRAKAGIAAGDKLEVEIEPDTEARVLALPADFQEALGREPGAQAFFEGLSYSNKRRFVMPIEEAKTDETRQKRIDKAIGLLREGRLP
ncbi:YdeI/OmpD-associated family protein [Cohnella sp. REN36]|uniref:YdeI/OmpD-associated family protein n=1 Tax=Cohnella sp. REN36 TaxID=2887347 RepID=UPI001D154E98|nr:YdeI/OmpD-associated family protein [Cohnella sp. REN36]MCC3371837.1 YdeI/OmpD-associated family protein [Cohnella sp. REN36]